MIVRSDKDIRALIADGRKTAGWSQSDLAERIGMSRQWVSLVERGRTSPDFASVLNALQALGYSVSVSRQGEVDVRDQRRHRPSKTSATRTALTMKGRPLKASRGTKTGDSTDG